MYTLILSLIALSTLASALSAPHISGYTPLTTIYGSYTPPPSQPSPTATLSTATPTPTPSFCPPPQPPNLAKSPAQPLFDFIAHLQQSPLVEDKLEERQQGGVGGGAGGVPPSPVQLSPITTIYLSGSMIIYTQTFAAVPDQMPTPMSGSIGMGTLKGTVGVVHSATGGAESLGKDRWKILIPAIILGGILLV